MKLLKPILTVFALAFLSQLVAQVEALMLHQEKQPPRPALSTKSKKAVSYESPYLETKNRLVMLTTTVLTKDTILNSGTNWHKTLV